MKEVTVWKAIGPGGKETSYVVEGWSPEPPDHIKAFPSHWYEFLYELDNGELISQEQADTTHKEFFRKKGLQGIVCSAYGFKK